MLLAVGTDEDVSVCVEVVMSEDAGVSVTSVVEMLELALAIVDVVP